MLIKNKCIKFHAHFPIFRLFVIASILESFLIGLSKFGDRILFIVCMYVCVSISFFRLDQINSTTIMTNKNRLTPHTDESEDLT